MGTGWLLPWSRSIILKTGCGNTISRDWRKPNRTGQWREDAYLTSTWIIIRFTHRQMHLFMRLRWEVMATHGIFSKQKTNTEHAWTFALIVGTQTQCSIHRSSETSQLHCIDQRQRFSRCSCQNHVYAMHMQQTAWNPRIFLLRWPGDTNSRPGTHRSLIENITAQSSEAIACYGF